MNDSMGEETRKVGKDQFRGFNGTSRYSFLWLTGIPFGSEGTEVTWYLNLLAVGSGEMKYIATAEVPATPN